MTETTPPSQVDSSSSSSATNPTEAGTSKQTKFWDGNLPQAKGALAQLLAKTTINDQLSIASQVHKVFIDPSQDPSILQHNDVPTAIVLPLPTAERRVRILIGIGSGYGVNGITPSPINDKLLALHGEFQQGSTFPSVVTMPKDVLQTYTVKVMKESDFESEREEKITSGKLLQ